jgi:hypothetical protein
MSLGATLHPLGIPPLLLGGILIAAGLVLLAHFAGEFAAIRRAVHALRASGLRRRSLRRVGFA